VGIEVAEEAVDFVYCVHRKGNDDEEPVYCRSCQHSWFTKAELSYDMDAGFEVGIEGTM
jgi:hypothetical protein